MATLTILSEAPVGATTKEITVDELAKRLGLSAEDLEARLEKNLTVGDVHVSTALTTISTAYVQGEDDGGEKEKEKARLAGAAAKRFDLKVAKADPDQRKIFGWASVAAFDGVLVVDKQDDIIMIADLEKAAHEFTLYSRTQGDMHTDIGVGRMIESVVFDQAKREAGIVAKDDQGRTIDGWWVGFLVDDDGVWEAHKRGERPEFSIGGRAQREPAP
jgi:hypothetical protein